MYEFKDEFLTGIEMIDNEHRRLFERVWITETRFRSIQTLFLTF